MADSYWLEQFVITGFNVTIVVGCSAGAWVRMPTWPSVRSAITVLPLVEPKLAGKMAGSYWLEQFVNRFSVTTVLNCLAGA
jgi:hypothetical protein